MVAAADERMNNETVKKLWNSFNLTMGDISFEMFMIHLLVIRSWEYAQWVARRIFGRPIPGISSALCVFAITVVGAWLIQKAMATMKKKQEAVHERK